MHRRTWLRSAAALAGLPGLAIGRPVPATATRRADDGPIDLGTRRELFVDRFLIDRLDGGAALTLEPPRDEGVALRLDRPWEGAFCGYATVIRDGPAFRMYYRGLPSAGADGSGLEVTCVAESPDGITWTRPELGLFERDGTRGNNVVLADMPPFSHNFCPMIDGRPGVPAAERYKALAGTGRSGLHAFASGDGLRWRQLADGPVLTEGAFDSQNVPFWSEHEGRYLCYFRVFVDGIRRIARAESDDFLRWSGPSLMGYGDRPIEHLYTNQTAPYFRAPHLYLGIAARFMPGRQVITPDEAAAIGVDPSYFGDCSDAVLITTRGGDTYDRTFMEGFLVPGIGPENWVSRTNYPARNVVPDRPDRALLLRQPELRPADGPPPPLLAPARRLRPRPGPLRGRRAAHSPPDVRRRSALPELCDLGGRRHPGRGPGAGRPADPRLRPGRRGRDDRQRDRPAGPLAGRCRSRFARRPTGPAPVRDEGREPLRDEVPGRGGGGVMTRENLSRRSALGRIAAMAGASAIAGTARGDEPRFRLGCVSADVTIPPGHPCMGGGIEPAREVLDPLLARGVVLIGGDRPVVILAVDWCEIRNEAYERWRAAIAEAAGTTPDRVLVASVHQHDAPVADLEAERLLRDAGAAGSVCDPEFHEVAVGRVAGAVREAVAGAVPITHVGTGSAVVERVASNRRYLRPDGTPAFDRTSTTRDPYARDQPEGTVDPVLRTLSFWDGDRPVAALSAYATHPMSSYGHGLVSADFVGLARRRRQEEDPETFQVYLSGCSGNVTAGKYNDGSPGTREALAGRLSEAMAAAWRDTDRRPLTAIGFRSVPLVLEPRADEGFTVDDLTGRLEHDPSPFGQCLAAMGLSWRRRCEAGRPIDLPVVDLGGALFALLPAESYVEFQLLAQRLRPDCLRRGRRLRRVRPRLHPDRAGRRRGGHEPPRLVLGRPRRRAGHDRRPPVGARALILPDPPGAATGPATPQDGDRHEVRTEHRSSTTHDSSRHHPPIVPRRRGRRRGRERGGPGRFDGPAEADRPGRHRGPPPLARPALRRSLPARLLLGGGLADARRRPRLALRRPVPRGRPRPVDRRPPRGADLPDDRRGADLRDLRAGRRRRGRHRRARALPEEREGPDAIPPLRLLPAGRRRLRGQRAVRPCLQ